MRIVSVAGDAVVMAVINIKNRMWRSNAERDLITGDFGAFDRQSRWFWKIFIRRQTKLQSLL